MRKTIGLLTIITSLTFIIGCSKEDPPYPGEKTNYPGTTPIIPTTPTATLKVFRQESCGLDQNTDFFFSGGYYSTLTSYSTFDRDCSSGTSSSSSTLVNRDLNNLFSETFYVAAQTQDAIGYWAGFVELFPDQCRYLELRCDGYMGGDAFVGYDSDLGIGTITFWADYSTCLSFNQIYINVDQFGLPVGSGTVYPTYESDNHCSNYSDKGYRIDLPEGDYHYRAEEVGSTRFWDYNISITAGDCRIYKLFCN